MKTYWPFAALFALTACAATPSSGEPASKTYWVYHNGAFKWDGDWSFSAKPNYRDTSGKPAAGRYDIEIIGTKWGAWQPYVHGECQTTPKICFDTLPYNYLIFSAKPTLPNQIFGAGFMSSGDTRDGIVLSNLAEYCSGGATPAVGEWQSCKVPLSAFKLTNTTILKFWIQDQTGRDNNCWYTDDVGFSVD